MPCGIVVPAATPLADREALGVAGRACDPGAAIRQVLQTAGRAPRR